MAKDKKQGKQPKPQSDKNEKVIHYDRDSSSGDNIKFSEQRTKKGTAGDGTNSTGPRKTE